MKVLRTYYIFLFSTVIISQEKETIKYEDLYERNGLIYASDQDSSFNGTVDENWPTGINKLSYTDKNGKPDSKWSDWFNNGQPKEEVEYSDGIKNGLQTVFNSITVFNLFFGLTIIKPITPLRIWFPIFISVAQFIYTSRPIFIDSPIKTTILIRGINQTISLI